MENAILVLSGDGTFRTFLLSPPALPTGLFLGRRFLGRRFLRVSMGLTDRRKTAKNLADSRKN